MDTETEFGGSALQHITIQHCLTVALENLRLQKFPRGFPKPIHILQPVDDSVDDQLAQRLQQSVTNNIKEHILLVPYYLGKFYWIGIFIEFKENQHIRRAELIDPVIDSKFVPDKIQKEIAKYDPCLVLSSKQLQKHGDPKNSARLIIRHLIKSVEESLLTDISYQNINDLHNRIADEQQNQSCIQEDNQFDYQKDRSTHEILSELACNGGKF
ncbi:unnamed protein product, partial [Rotaria sp. Silwood2]